jgi:hypothetical protein
MNRKTAQDIVFRPEIFFKRFSVSVLFRCGREHPEGSLPPVGRPRTGTKTPSFIDVVGGLPFKRPVVFLISNGSGCSGRQISSYPLESRSEAPPPDESLRVHNSFLCQKFSPLSCPALLSDFPGQPERGNRHNSVRQRDSFLSGRDDILAHRRQVETGRMKIPSPVLGRGSA